MPELPAVEYSRRLLEDNVVGLEIKEVQAQDDPVVFDNVQPSRIIKELKGKRILSAHRYGKYLWLTLSDETWLLMHFGMTGFVEVKGLDRLYYKSAPESNETLKASTEWPPRFWKLVINTEKESQFALGDSRRLGHVKILHQEPRTITPVSELGFDPILTMPPCDEAFREQVRRRGIPLKSFLLDQSFAAGVGNWMADDIMLHARLHPERRVCDLSDEEIDKLHQAIVYISETAVAMNSDGTKFPSEWLFHRRWPTDRKKSGHLGSANDPKVEFIRIGGRTTAFIPSLQKKSGSIQSPPSKTRGSRIKVPSKRSRKH